jgi:ADP-ribosylglycohydrolase
MRVAPLGAFFADDLAAVVEQAQASADVTHGHPEGQAGAIAVAVAAAWTAATRADPADGQALLAAAAEHAPPGETRQGILRALALPAETEPEEAAEVLGNGSGAIAPDTVPFALWCAARHLDDFSAALWAAVSAGGDTDTVCAIVGGIVALRTGIEGIPDEWLRAREPLALAPVGR